MRSWFGGFAIAAIAIVSSAVTPSFAGHVLITEEEAKLPPPKGAVATDRRGVTRGPKVKFVVEGEPVRSPMHLKSFVQATGIDIPDVELPAGEHMVRVDVKDSDGRIGTTSFVLKVEP